jgi:hypothetical protein
MEGLLRKAAGTPCRLAGAAQKCKGQEERSMQMVKSVAVVASRCTFGPVCFASLLQLSMVAVCFLRRHPMKRGLMLSFLSYFPPRYYCCPPCPLIFKRNLCYSSHSAPHLCFSNGSLKDGSAPKCTNKATSFFFLTQQAWRACTMQGNFASIRTTIIPGTRMSLV